jgi:DNA-binding transcriptional LysR family regulator
MAVGAAISGSLLKNWDDIRLLLAIAENGGIAAAADSMKLHEATVERRLADLEATVGRPLFRRVQRRGSVPTAACQYLLERASAMRSAASSFDRAMGAVRHLPETVSVTAPAAVLRFTLVPALLGDHQTEQPFECRNSAYPLPPMTFSTSGASDVTVMLTSAGDMPDIQGDLTIRRVGVMHLAAFAPRRTAEVSRVHSFRDLRSRQLFQRADYQAVRSMAPWNEICQGAKETRKFDGSEDIYREFKASSAITIFPNYSGMYDAEAVRLDLDDMPDISLSVWIASRRDMLKEPSVRKVFDAVGSMFSDSTWFS